MFAEQVFPKHFIPQSILIIEGVISIYNSENLKQKKHNLNLRLSNMVSSKNPKQDFSPKKLFRAISSLYTDGTSSKELQIHASISNKT